MIINLSHEIRDIDECIAAFRIPEEEQLIVDFNTTIKLHRPSFFSICELPDFDELNEKITRNFIKDIGTLSTYTVNNRPLVSYQVAGLPVFWCTDLAVKYPFISPAKAIYLLKELFPLVKKKYKVPQQVYISLSQAYLHFSGLIESVLKAHGVMQVCFLSKEKKFSFYDNVFRHLFVFHSKLSLLKWRHSKPPENKMPANFFITNAAFERLNEGYSDFYFHNLFLMSAKERQTFYWPIFGNYQALSQSSALPPGYIKASPGWMQFAIIIGKLFYFSSFFKIKRVQPSGASSLFGNSEILQTEIRNLLRYHYAVYYLGVWLRNYFSRTSFSNPVTVFYQDEFYHTGRIISSALNSTKVKKVGVQHGLFDLNHTVYGISDQELNNPYKPLPAPDVFTVWSDWFRKYFVSNHTSGAMRVITAGSPKHFDMQEKPAGKVHTPLRVLWCTDNLELTQNDLRYIEPVILNNANYRVTLRKHPLYDYMDVYTRQLKLFEKFSNLKLSVNESIFADIDEHDVIIVNCFTTVFVDAYLKKKPCIRLFPFKGSPAYVKQFTSHYIKNVSSPQQMADALEDFTRMPEGEPQHDNGLISNRVDEWKKILYKDDNRY